MRDDRQERAIRLCEASDDLDYWLVGSQGEKFRPSDWADMLASNFTDLYILEQKKRLSYHCVNTVFENGRKCLKVRKVFARECPGGWDFLTGFAVCNNLSIIDNEGEVFEPTLTEGLTCDIIHKELMAWPDKE